MVGLAVGVVRMFLDFIYPEPGCGEIDDRPLIVARIHYMYFALLLCLLTGITVVSISYAGKPPDPSKVGISAPYRRVFGFYLFSLLFVYFAQNKTTVTFPCTKQSGTAKLEARLIADL